MFNEHLEKIRSKPEHIKNRYAFFGAFGMTAIIFVFWLGTTTSIGRVGVPASATLSKAEPPASTMIAGVGEFFEDIRDAIFGSKKVEYKNIEVLPGE